MRRFCESLPADRLLHGNDYDLEGQLAKEKSLQSYTEPETGAKLTYGSSLAVLAHFVGCLVSYLCLMDNPHSIFSSPTIMRPRCK